MYACVTLLHIGGPMFPGVEPELTKKSRIMSKIARQLHASGTVVDLSVTHGGGFVDND
jgi:hypothetical protein